MRNSARAAIASVLLTSAIAMAQTTGATYSGGGIESNWSGAIGWHFTMNSAVNVTALGMFDLGASGFTDDHEVGLFAAANPGVALASVSLASGTSGYLLDNTRWVDLGSAVALTTGVEYYLLVDECINDLWAYAGTAAFASEVSWIGQAYSSSPGITELPTFSGGLPGDLGPNMRFGAVPEPATMAALGLGVMAMVRRRKRA